MAFFQWLPRRGARAAALELALVVAGVHADDLLLEELLDGLADLNLVRVRPDAEDVLVPFSDRMVAFSVRWTFG
jgi:hypothetical protein